MNINERHRALLADYNYLKSIGTMYDETGGWLPDEQIVVSLKCPQRKLFAE